MKHKNEQKSLASAACNEITINPPATINALPYIQAATSENTRKAYQADIRHFIQAGGLLPANIDILQQYLSAHADKLNPRTLVRRLTAIKQWHVTQGFPDPTSHPMLRKLLTGIKKVHGKPKDKAQPLTLEALAQMVRHLEGSNKLIDFRNNALLQVGFFGAFRRSELVSLTWEQVTFLPEGMEVLLTRSKTDQEGEGQICSIPYGNDELCAVRSILKWQKRRQQNNGPIFCHVPINETVTAIKANQVNHIIKSTALKTGLPEPFSYSSHSLRRGFATQASKKGAPFGAIMRQGRWRHKGTVFGYIEEGKRFDSNAVDIMLQPRGDNLSPNGSKK